MRALLAAVFVVSALGAAEDGVLLFSFFRNNGEDGLYLASSEDGLRWTPMNGDRPLLAPQVGESKLMRDPSITRGPDGTFHMVWTTSWRGKTIGYANTKDLVHWSAQRVIEPFADEAEPLNCWAPEIFYDRRRKDFVIVWASTIAGRFPETLGAGTRDYNHRLYIVHTRDFKTFSKPRLVYEPGFQVIDGAIFPTESGYGMVVKNETQTPPAKYLFLAFSKEIDGPYSKPSEPISGPQWAEGPSPIFLTPGRLVIYFDKYRDKRYGAIRADTAMAKFEDITAQVAPPAGARHGTVLRVPAKIARALQALH